MTQQAPKVTVLEMPPPSMPMCTRVWARHPLKPTSNPSTSSEPAPPVLWAVNTAHPFVGSYVVRRMYVMPGLSVDIYSTNTSSDGKQGGELGLRHTVPWHEVLFIEEAMDPETFIQEMIEAEAGDDDDEDDDEPEELPTQPLPEPLQALPPVAPIPINGAGGTG